VAYDPSRKELVFWNGESAYYSLPIAAIDGCNAADRSRWHTTQPAGEIFTKHTLTGRFKPQQSAFARNAAGPENVTYSKFDRFGAVELADGTRIDGLFVGGNAQSEGIWVFRR
jgi:hypothetical protein